MTVMERIDRLAKSYNIDYSHVIQNFNDGSLSATQIEIFQNLPSNKLVAIWNEFSGHTIIDSFLMYAKQYIPDKSQLQLLTFSLLTLIENDISENAKRIEKDHQIWKELHSKDKENHLLDELADLLTKAENYHCKLLYSKGMILMEIDNFKTNPPILQKSITRPPSSHFAGFVWAGKKRLDLVNLIYQTLKIDCIDPSTKYSHFEKLFSGISLKESFIPINWIHQGGASSLCFLFYLLTKDPPLISSTRRNKVIALAFTVNQKKLNPNSLKTTFSKINSGIIPTYYNDLETRIDKILRSAKS